MMDGPMLSISTRIFSPVSQQDRFARLQRHNPTFGQICLHFHRTARNQTIDGVTRMMLTGDKQTGRF
jgi:hypothetical protein